ncbi:dephospho-CoA kinase [Streptococcus acidominimus]|uniref:Dephospho-CoA kinase n=1 Tax=Streptococcus acidominimus TaxID=1326 RepID=A0A1Q8EBD1_STRAI|nr:dephospho-CoA kinase [Streptococcus acidominimus]MBF0848736.1 dephospho-CoA kinase [Streptococcus danieliae]MBF0818664.1 dephospho-CoA kinase [Streptococcus acidominimus]MBF0839074.1 dephospho-CoA kinase [Streptococcus acidominimus]OLF49087.1 dephospho-CoA kinase [Streptococcus acidominimus]TFU30952.1 dephospho-CoA kinase [Streptococcus acidominimus]
MTQVIGITGGIASGKSTVTDYLRKRGYSVIDADQVVHQLQEKGGKLYQVLVAEFGTSILAKNGELDRKQLARLVFEQAGVRERLSQLQNQVIRQTLLAKRDQLAQEEEVLFMDIPLLFELGYEEEVSEVWLLVLAPELQLERLMERNQLDQVAAKQRIAAQMPLEEKKKRTPYQIENSGERLATYAQVDQLLQRIERR